MADTWKHEVVERTSLLDKFQLALAIARKDLFDRGGLIYQEVDLLIKLRNGLVHYKPTWITVTASGLPGTETIPVHKMEKILKGKFLLNPLMSSGNAFYPDKCLSHGCAQWSVASCIRFVDEFYAKMGLSVPFEHIRLRLKTEA